ncbi:MAG: ShlB/FhaC/HecB family hemolysin secretion/activation protein [Bdellovibrionales bacterium]
MTSKKFLKFSVGAFIVSLACQAQPVNAQAVPAQLAPSQGIVDAGRLEDNLKREERIPDLGKSVKVDRAFAQGAPENAENITFNLRNLSIEGVSVYNEQDLQSVYADELGSTVSLADIYIIANRLTNKYRNEGFILTQVIVPPQTIEGGNVTLRVVEGFINRVVVEGNDDPSALALIQRFANNIPTGDALNIESLEKYLLLINDLPGVDARSVLSPSNSQAGASDLRIIVERKSYDALLGIDSFGSRFLGPIQTTAAGSLNSFFGNNESISGQFVMAPFGNNDPELAFGALSYEQPINALGTKASVFLSHSDTEPGLDIDIFDVKGRSTTYGIGLEHPIIRSRTRNLFVRGQLDARNVDSKSDIDITRKDRIRALRLGGRYEFLDTLFGVGINSIDAEISQGLDAFGSSDEGDAALTRPEGDPQFTKINVQAQRLQRVTNDINLLMAVSAQASNDALLSSEEFGVGGISFGRGFDASEIIGEDGFSTKLELQWRDPIETPISGIEDYTVYGFWDFGKVWNDDATISDDDESLASIGLGARANIINNFEAGAFVAIPLTRDVQAMGDDDARYFFNLSKRF